MKKLIPIAFFLLSFSVSAWAGNVTTNTGDTISLPYSQEFEGATWDNDGFLTSDECGGTARRATTGCYSGDCLKVIPPTTACTGGGTDGGAVGMGWFRYSGVGRIHFRFMIKIAEQFIHMYSGGNALVIKFILQDDPTRTGIMGLNASDYGDVGGTRYMAWAVTDNSSYRYKTAPNLGWIEDATFRISDLDNLDEWMCVEYWIDTDTMETGLYIWTVDGLEEEISGASPVTSSTQTAFYFNYYNSPITANADAYYLMDNLEIATSYIGPPAGFVGGEPEVPANAIQGVSISNLNVTENLTAWNRTDNLR